ncbi:MAG: DUF5110 domain-containing protein [Bacteroidales bacterium]|nr:DUF5110 domain-containing protein [Bacteroidales bacterium]
MKKVYVLVLLVTALLGGCSNAAFKKMPDGVVISLNPAGPERARTIRLQVITPDIIRVMASPGQQIEERESLITVARTGRQTPWDLQQRGDSILLKTATTHALVSLLTGEITFTDTLGNIVLQEQHGGGTTFDAIEVEGRKAYSMRQVFESPADEAFYGLGQHQGDEFNWKGRNEELFQYNTKVSVPFILSSRNYGILWDNYSLMRFGDPRPYSNLDALFTVYDKAGKAGGLTATYMVNKDPGNVFVERQEAKVDYEDIFTIRNFPEGFPFNHAAIRWEGAIQPRETGVFRFNLYYAGYTTVYVDDSLVVKERWRTAWNPNSYKFELKLEAGKRHSLRIEWQPDGGTSYIGLKALSPVPDAEQQKLSMWSEMGPYLDYYFIKGSSADEVISGYRTLTGKAPIMPKWAMGFWQSRERYKTQDELLAALKGFRRRNIPIDNIVLDWNYWPDDAWGSHDFDTNRFPDPKAMVDSIHALDARIMLSVWPKFYASTEHFKQFEQIGAMYMQAVKDSIRDWVGPGYIGSFYDAYNAEAREIFWKQMKAKLYPLGIDAWWMDASEPNIRDCTPMDYRKALCGPTALGPSAEYFNAYALMNAQAIYEGLKKEDPNQRVFQLTRSGFAGLQRYATATWSGDIATRWEDMKAQIPAGINFAMSGIPYWTMDNGGFCVEKRYERAPEGSADRDEWRELNARWHQFGAFVPLFRTHGQYPFREIWNIAPENHPAYAAILYYTQLRYRLLPYIYSLAAKTWFDDYTLMRGLMMNYPDDKATAGVGDQFLFGNNLMVCPVYEYKARTRPVYFPAGTDWYDLYSGKKFNGGRRLTVDAPYERIPVFVPAGAIVPMGDVVQHTNEPQNRITLYVFAGNNGRFTLYDDEGVNENYRNGMYSKIALHYDDATRTLTLDDREGSYEGMAREREFRVILVSDTRATGIDTEATEVQSIRYTGNKQTVRL